MEDTACKKDKFLSFSVGFFIIYMFFGYILQRTVFPLQQYVFAVIVIVMITFGILLLKYFNGKLTATALLWLPYLLYTMYDLAQRGNWERFSYWFACFVIVVIARRCEFEKYISMKMLFFIGMFFAIGVYVQYFFPDFHAQHIAKLFEKGDQIEFWGEEYGFAGFAYQLDASAVPAMIGSFVCLFCLERQEGKSPLKNKIIYVIMAIAVFMTGKRMTAIVSVSVPMLVYLFSQKKLTGRLKALFVVSIVIIFAYYIIYYNLDYFDNTRAMHRIVESIYDVENNVDITSGRSDLYELAFLVFKRNWFTGIGVGNFIRYTNAYTDVHNTFLQTMCEQGVVGFTLYVIPLAVYLFSTVSLLIRNKNAYCEKYFIFSLGMQLAYILYSFSGNTNINLWGFCMYFIAVGVTESCVYRNEKESLGEIS